MDLPGLTFSENARRELDLQYAPAGGRTMVDAALLRGCAGDCGYAELAFDDKALDAAAARIRKGESCAAVVARRADAEYLIEIAADKMSAWLTVVAAHGGKPASALDAVAALGARSVREGVDAAAVEEAVQTCGERHLIARGTPPTPGKDAWLEPLVMVNRDRQPRIDDSGHVDFHDLGAIPTVAAGEAVMRRHPPQPGIAGANVLGEPLAPPVPKDITFGLGLTGVAVGPETDVLVAEIAGQPVLQRDGVTVEPIVRCEQVDVSTGNIDFPGSIEVRGDVKSGMKLRAGGDIVVLGVVESAQLTAGGDVKVQGGVIGHSESAQAFSGTARILAHGGVRAKFLENAVVEAQKSVQVEEAIVQSDVTALDQIVVGGKGKKGRVLGGRLRATALVAADFVGGEGAGRTQVTVGVNPLLQRMLDEHRQRLDARLKQHDDLSKIVKLLRGNADKQAMCDKARLTLQKVSEEIGEEIERQRVLEAETRLADNATIVVGEKLAAGVTVAIGRKSRYVNEDLGRGVYRLDQAGELDYGTLARRS